MNGQVKYNTESLFKTFVHLPIFFDASTETQYSDALGHTVRWETGMAAAILRLPNGVGCAMLKTNTIGSERKGNTSMKMIR